MILITEVNEDGEKFMTKSISQLSRRGAFDVRSSKYNNPRDERHDRASQ